MGQIILLWKIQVIAEGKWLTVFTPGAIRVLYSHH